MASIKELFVRQVKALKPSLFSKTPHFNFISAHCEHPSWRAHDPQLLSLGSWMEHTF